MNASEAALRILQVTRLWENGTSENRMWRRFRDRELVHTKTAQAVQAFKAAYRQ